MHRDHPVGRRAHRDACHRAVAESDDLMPTKDAPRGAGESDDRMPKRDQRVAGAAGPQEVLHRVQAGARAAQVAAAQSSEACRRVWLDVVRASAWDDHSR